MSSISKPASASRRIVRNSFWYGLEGLLETIVYLGTSVAVARYLGPEKLGYFSYINTLVTIITNTSSSGMVSATRKYMSEFIGLGEMGTAHAVYHLTHRYQLVSAVIVTSVCLFSIVIFGDTSYKLMASILIISLIPGVMSRVPAGANLAFEDSFHNTISALGYISSYAVVIVLTIHFKWGLVGIASATLVGRSFEVVLRTISLNKRLRLLPTDLLPRELIYRIRRFCLQSVVVQIFSSVVWDRSEMFFLRYFSNLQSIAFYSISYGFSKNLLQLPRVFSSSSTVTIMVECARDPKRVDKLVRNTCRFLLFLALPVNLGAAAVGNRAIHLAYGLKYVPAIPVLIVCSVLIIPQVFGEITGTIYQAADAQKQVLINFCLTGVVTVVFDYFLIRRYGAVGAAWANGLSQLFGIVLMWQVARRYYVFSFPVGAALRLLVAALSSTLVAYLIVNSLSGVLGFVAAIVAAVPVYLVMVRLMRALEPDDRYRLALIGDRMPGFSRHLSTRIIDFLTPQTSPADQRPEIDALP
jgi:O-antigen/teichoic acid export membrane protein